LLEPNHPDFRELRLKIQKVFVPGTPISKYDLFSGRHDQMTQAMGAVLQPGRHVAVFGERGVGKTSLAKVLITTQESDGYHTLETLTMNCDESDDFTTLWRKIFRVLPYGYDEGKTVYLDSFLPTEEVLPDDVRYCLSRFRSPSLIALDEIDKLKNSDARNLLAATIKNLSDHATNTTLILIGVADSVDELIDEHKSVARALVTVPMPRMSDAEIAEIVDTGTRNLGMTIDESATRSVINFSRGFPFYAHSFGLHGGLKAIDDKRLNITVQDVGEATVNVALSAREIQTAHYKAVLSAQKTSRYETALLACALAEADSRGLFAAAAVRYPLSVLLNRDIDIPRYKHYLTEFCKPERGAILEPRGEKGRLRYRFADPLMLPFVVISAVGSQKLSLERLIGILSGTAKVADDQSD
jgi:Cdc6-like AAA superfamily ATPase